MEATTNKSCSATLYFFKLVYLSVVGGSQTHEEYDEFFVSMVLDLLRV